MYIIESEYLTRKNAVANTTVVVYDFNFGRVIAAGLLMRAPYPVPGSKLAALGWTQVDIANLLEFREVVTRPSRDVGLEPYTHGALHSSVRTFKLDAIISRVLHQSDFEIRSPAPVTAPRLSTPINPLDF